MTTTTLQEPQMTELLRALTALKKGQRDVRLPAKWGSTARRAGAPCR